KVPDQSAPEAAIVRAPPRRFAESALDLFGISCVVKEIQRVNAREALAQGGSFRETASWHAQYSDSAYVFVGGFSYELSEGDLICIFSQYGEVVDINLVRDKESGKSKGFAFLCYEDQRSTILAVDNLNGIKGRVGGRGGPGPGRTGETATLCWSKKFTDSGYAARLQKSGQVMNRTIRVDHCAQYKRPKKDEKAPEGEHSVYNAAPKPLETAEESEDSWDDERYGLNPEDPMYEHLLKKAKKARRKQLKKERKETKKARTSAVA
ncbi:MAG: hypothetical protein BJ554DRAFT_1211, partial [Olpidium bornovanus]